jgi:hypothetical protein
MLSATLFPRPNSRASFLVIHFVRNYSVPAGHQVPNKKVWDSVDAAVGAVKSGDVRRPKHYKPPATLNPFIISPVWSNFPTNSHS